MARQEVKIPHERVAVLIGVNGAVKKRIEENSIKSSGAN